MSMNLKEILDLPAWRPTSIAPTSTAAGTATCGDQRVGEDRDPHLYYLASNILLHKYSMKNNDWITLSSPAILNSLAAGSDAVFKPDGPSGTIAAGATTTTVVLSTALPAAVATNQLANRGDGRGYKIRITGNTAGGSGKVEERLITGNTAGTTPTITLDSALSFTPAVGSTYEILSGRVWMLGAGAIGAGTWKYYDIATNTYVTRSQTNLPTTISTDSHLVVLSELHCPLDAFPGEGLVRGAGTYNGGNLRCLTATATTANTLTGQTSGGDYGLTANEYRNFQIRIVEDLTNPTAVGQRRNITSHTGGAAAPVYTLASNWTVTPSATAKYTLEYNNDRIILFTSGNGNTYNYSIAGDAWDVSTTWAVRGANVGVGVIGEFAFGAPRDTTGNHRHSFLTSMRGGNVNIVDVFDIAGAATGTWSLDIAYGNKGNTLFTTGTCGVYNPATQGGRYLYLNLNGTQRNYRFDMVNRVLEPYAYLMYGPMGTVAAGRRAVIVLYTTGTTYYPFFTLQAMSSAPMFQNFIFR